jgi:hypothetical protein
VTRFLSFARSFRPAFVTLVLEEARVPGAIVV